MDEAQGVEERPWRRKAKAATEAEEVMEPGRAKVARKAKDLLGARA
ncbi:hypothetical protein OHT61_06770 [Streptomyces sp. NBC_00178]|nr:hypothetical protein [Streptomyces sp. NBC_00178]